jgi:hypothetical protein
MVSTPRSAWLLDLRVTLRKSIGVDTIHRCGCGIVGISRKMDFGQGYVYLRAKQSGASGKRTGGTINKVCCFLRGESATRAQNKGSHVDDGNGWDARAFLRMTRWRRTQPRRRLFKCKEGATPVSWQFAQADEAEMWLIGARLSTSITGPCFCLSTSHHQLPTLKVEPQVGKRNTLSDLNPGI